MQINIGILGLGTVGCGTWMVLQRNADLIEARSGCKLVVKHIATRTPSRPRDIEVPADILSADIERVLADPEIHILRALNSGKSVVTANKELIAKHGPEIVAAAAAAGVDFRFEGSVGGGIPLVAPLRESLVANRVRQMLGILNGTTNYILTKMTREGLDFDDVLAEAQQLGYAEADPTSDVDGFDTMYKLQILATIAFGVPVSIDSIYREGIRGVGARDIEYAREQGFVIKLLAVARQDESGEIELRVHPALIPQTHALAGVNDVYNGVLINGDAAGDVMFYGRGAGSEPTASAVVADLVEVARDLRSGATNRVSEMPLNTASTRASFKAFDDIETRFCVRMQVADKPGTLARIATVFGENGVSLDSIVQKRADGESAEIFWMTHRTSQRAMRLSLEAFARLESAPQVSSILRVEGEETSS
jgi:homoserine dehydrogenase